MFYVFLLFSVTLSFVLISFSFFHFWSILFNSNGHWTDIQCHCGLYHCLYECWSSCFRQIYFCFSFVCVCILHCGLFCVFIRSKAASLVLCPPHEFTPTQIHFHLSFLSTNNNKQHFSFFHPIIAENWILQENIFLIFLRKWQEQRRIPRLSIAPTSRLKFPFCFEKISFNLFSSISPRRVFCFHRQYPQIFGRCRTYWPAPPDSLPLPAQILPGNLSPSRSLSFLRRVSAPSCTKLATLASSPMFNQQSRRNLLTTPPITTGEKIMHAAETCVVGLDRAVGYCRSGAVYPFTFGLACCAMEMIDVPRLSPFPIP